MVIKKRFDEWMNQEVNIKRTVDSAPVLMKRLQRFAELVAVNNGTTQIRQVGNVIDEPRHPYKRLGLNLGESLEFAEYNGCLATFVLLDNTIQEHAITILSGEIDRVRKEGAPGEGSRIQIYSEEDLKTAETVEKQIRTIDKNVRKT